MTIIEYPELLIAGRDINRGVHEKGFYEEARTPGDIFMLVVSEMAEALEEFRDGHALDEIYFKVNETFFAKIDDFGNMETFVKGSQVPLGVYNVIIEHNRDAIRYLKPEGVPIELADGLIRILDTLYAWGVSPTLATYIKMRYNETRPHKHGKVHL